MSSTEAKIPMIDLRAQHAELEEEIFEGFSAVLASGRFVLGDAVEAFESELASICRAKFAIGCNSGTDALWLALRGLGIGPGDAVLCPAYSFFATAATIVRVGARPVFADIHAATFNLDPEDAIRRAENVAELRAVISVDLFGRICELGPLEAYCKDRGIHIIQDAAQSIGALDAKGQEVGARSDVACFSFYPTKNLGALGDAGGLVTNDRALAESISRLRVHGECESGVYEEIGINSRLDALQAIALSVKLRHLDKWTRARRQLAAHYDALFLDRGARVGEETDSRGNTGSTGPIGGTLSLLLPADCPSPGSHTYHRYVIRVPAERRDGLVEALAREGIESAVFYPRGLHQQPALAAHAPQAPEASLSETERACRESLALPLFPELGIDRVELVVSAVAKFLAS
jgi:dTDP-4-amino-4,6-dideoxygalactose transaminase